MKRKLFFILLYTITLFSSCTPDDSDVSDFHYEILPITSVDVPEEFTLGETYDITVTYNKPSTCYLFYDFYYQTNSSNERTVAVVNTVLTGDECIDLEGDIQEQTFNFKVIYNVPSYTFKFWQGKNEAGEDQYIVVEVPTSDTVID